MPTIDAIVGAAQKGPPLAAFLRGTRVKGGGKMSLLRRY